MVKVGKNSPIYNAHSYHTKGARPYRVAIPKEKGVTADAVKFAAERVDPNVKWQEEAYARLVKVPRIFLTRVITECVKAAQEESVTEITPEFLDRIRDKRGRDKSK